MADDNWPRLRHWHPFRAALAICRRYKSVLGVSVQRQEPNDHSGQYKYIGTAYFSILKDCFPFQHMTMLFVCITATADLICYLFIPIQWMIFLSCTYVWLNLLWATYGGFLVALSTLSGKRRGGHLSRGI